jgi:hypothetical protein
MAKVKLDSVTYDMRREKRTQLSRVQPHHVLRITHIWMLHGGNSPVCGANDRPHWATHVNASDVGRWVPLTWDFEFFV